TGVAVPDQVLTSDEIEPLGMRLFALHQQARRYSTTNTSDSRRPRGYPHGSRQAEMADSWLMKLCRCRHKNIAAVALAAKNARTAWAMLIRGQAYQASHVPAQPQYDELTGPAFNIATPFTFQRLLEQTSIL